SILYPWEHPEGVFDNIGNFSLLLPILALFLPSYYLSKAHAFLAELKQQKSNLDNYFKAARDLENKLKENFGLKVSLIKTGKGQPIDHILDTVNFRYKHKKAIETLGAAD